MSHQCVPLQCVTARRPTAASTSNAGIFHGCLVVDRHREHVGSNIRCWLRLPARWRRCQSSLFTHCKEHTDTCGVRTSRSSSLSSGPQTARTRDSNPGIPNPGIPDHFLNPESRDWRCFNPGISGLWKINKMPEFKWYLPGKYIFPNFVGNSRL